MSEPNPAVGLAPTSLAGRAARALAGEWPVFSVYTLGQFLFALVVLALIAERAVVLLWHAPTSDRALRWLGGHLRRGETEIAIAWARATPRAFVARVLLGTLSEGPEDERDPNFVGAELRHAATLRLGALRICATLASVLGLLGGVLAIRAGFSGQGGLLELQAGLAQQVALANALERMALGLGTSAVCFHALSVFRRAARDLVAQSTQVAHLIADRAIMASAQRRGEVP